MEVGTSHRVVHTRIHITEHLMLQAVVKYISSELQKQPVGLTSWFKFKHSACVFTWSSNLSIIGFPVTLETYESGLDIDLCFEG